MPNPIDRRNRAASAARDLNLASVEFLANEFETYQLLREEMPVARVPEGNPLAHPGGAWLLTRYADVAEVLRAPASFSNQTSNYPVRPWIPQAVDPPMHTGYRRIMNPWFTVEQVSRLKPHLVAYTDQLLDAMLARSEFDYVAEFADPFPTVIFCELMGFPASDYPQLMDWKNALMHPADGHVRGAETAARFAREYGLSANADGTLPHETLLALRTRITLELYRYFQRLLDERRASPTDDLISRLLAARFEGERPLGQEELEDCMLLLFMGGLDTVASTLGLIVETLARRDDKRREFVAAMEDEEKLTLAVEELVRLHAIVTPPRRVVQELSFHGALFRAEDTVLCSLPSANRDPEEFPDPEAMNLARMPNRHLAFGLGPHRCLGVHLARQELRIALRELHRRLPDYRLHPTRAPEPFGGMKGMGSLWLVKA
jgi:cytochrome P450